MPSRIESYILGINIFILKDTDVPVNVDQIRTQGLSYVTDEPLSRHPRANLEMRSLICIIILVRVGRVHTLHAGGERGGS